MNARLRTPWDGIFGRLGAAVFASLTETEQRNHTGEIMVQTSRHSVTIAKRRFELRRDRVEQIVGRVLPEPILSHYVVIGSRRYTPKQVIGLVTGSSPVSIGPTSPHTRPGAC
jgi:hypothetical protein